MTENISIHKTHIKQHKAESKPAVDSKQYIPKEFSDAAKDMEQQFAEHMLKQMERTVEDSSTSTASQYYKSLMNSEHSKTLSENRGGLGIQKVVLNQIYPEKFRNERAYNAYMQQHNKQKIVKPKYEMHSVPTKESMEKTIKMSDKNRILKHQEEALNE